MNLLQYFHEALALYYPIGKECLFLPYQKWSQLCHIRPNTGANRELCRRAFGNEDMIDCPVVNVIPGSRPANFECYTMLVVLIPEQVIEAARVSIYEYNNASRSKNHGVIDAPFLFSKSPDEYCPADIDEEHKRFRRALEKAMAPWKNYEN